MSFAARFGFLFASATGVFISSPMLIVVTFVHHVVDVPFRQARLRAALTRLIQPQRSLSLSGSWTATLAPRPAWLRRLIVVLGAPVPLNERRNQKYERRSI
jgi:hypothetical protein